MTKRSFVLLLLLGVFVLSAGCGVQPAASTPGPAPTAAATPVPPPQPTPTPDPAAEVLAGLSVEQKVGQLLVAGIEGTQPEEDAVRAIRDYQVGGIILFGRNVESAGQLCALTNGLKQLNGAQIPLFLCVDQEGGRVDRMPPEVARTPSAWQVGETLDPEGAGAAYGALLAEECAAFGFNVDFAPCLDIWSNPENTVIGDRAFSDNQEWTARFGQYAVEGMQQQGNIIPVVKHFPGHGDTAMDSHEGLPVVDKTLDELWQREFMPFYTVLHSEQDTGGTAVMVGHIRMDAVDPNFPATLSHKVVTELLREEIGFDGVVFTDDLTMRAITDAYGLGDAAVRAVEAGCDALLVCHGEESLTLVYEALMEAVKSGDISQARLDQSVYRILALKQTYGINNVQVETPELERLNSQIKQLLSGT